ncbi:MAG: hypothetical protein ACK4FS_03515 [Flavobacterium sp.]
MAISNLNTNLNDLRATKSFKEISREIKSEMYADNLLNIQRIQKLHPWAIENYSKSRIFDSTNITIADLTFTVSHFQINKYQKLINHQEPYSYKVYTHFDGSEVLKMYKDNTIKPKDNEVLLFIEIDDGKFDFGKIVRVKLGKRVYEDLVEKSGFFNDEAEKLAERYLKASWKAGKSEETRQAVEKEKNTYDFKELLIKAIKYEKKGKDFDSFSWFLLFIRGSDFLGFNMPQWLFELSDSLRTKKISDEKYWNGSLPDSEYTPAFIPNFLVYENQEDRKEYFNELFYTPISALKRSIEDKLNLQNPIHNLVNRIVDDSFRKVYVELSEFIDTLSVIALPEGNYKQFIKHVNAFWVGFYNGLIELISGLLELTAILILILRKEFGFRMGDEIKERFEEVFNDLVNDTETIIIKCFKKVDELLRDFGKWLNTYEGKSYYIVKEIGEIVPDILTFLLPVLKGSKVSKISAISTKTGKEIREKATEQTIQKLTKEEAEKIAKTAKEALEDGTAKQSSKKAVQEAEEKLDDLVKFADEYENLARFKNVVIKNVDDLIKFLENMDETVIATQLDGAGIKALFRGTTKNSDGTLFTGNVNSQLFGLSTSTDPLRAIVFGIESANNSSKKGVLQILVPKQLKGVKLQAPNRRVHYELEVVLQSSSKDLANFVVKEIPIEDARLLANKHFKLIEKIPKTISDGRESRELLEYILPKSGLSESLEFYIELLKIK